MALPTDFIASLQPMSLREAFETFKDRPWANLQASVEIRNEVRPVDLFCYLGARFGRPNGMQNVLRSDDSDNLIHWDWTLRHHAGVVVFLGMNFRSQVHIFGLADDGKLKEDLVHQIKSDLALHGPAMGAVRKALEHWVEFVNPFQRIRRSVDRLVEELDSLGLKPQTDQFDPLGPAALDEGTPARWEELATRYSKGFGLCFGVRSLLPVMAEAFVNLLLYVLIRPEIRADQRLMDSVFRSPVDVRIRGLAINCLGFKQSPDYANEVCRNYHSLVNERNDLLHGNVAVDKLKFNEVYFLGKVPVFREYKNAWERSLKVEADSVGLDAVRSELATVNALTDYLISCLDDSLREDVKFLIDSHELGFNAAAGRTGVLFSQTLADAHLSPASPANKAGKDDDKKG